MAVLSNLYVAVEISVIYQVNEAPFMTHPNGFVPTAPNSARLRQAGRAPDTCDTKNLAVPFGSAIWQCHLAVFLFGVTQWGLGAVSLGYLKVRYPIFYNSTGGHQNLEYLNLVSPVLNNPGSPQKVKEGHQPAGP